MGFALRCDSQPVRQTSKTKFQLDSIAFELPRAQAIDRSIDPLLDHSIRRSLACSLACLLAHPATACLWEAPSGLNRRATGTARAVYCRPIESISPFGWKACFVVSLASIRSREPPPTMASLKLLVYKCLFPELPAPKFG